MGENIMDDQAWVDSKMQVILSNLLRSTSSARLDWSSSKVSNAREACYKTSSFFNSIRKGLG